MNEEENNVQTTSTSNTTNERKGFNITALILGIISIVTVCMWYLSIPSGIVAIIFSIAGKKDAGRGMGVAGMVLGIIGLIVAIIWILVIVFTAAALINDPSLTNSLMTY